LSFALVSRLGKATSSQLVLLKKKKKKKARVLSSDKKKKPAICTDFHIMLSPDSIFDYVPSLIIFRLNLEDIRNIDGFCFQIQMVMGLPF
jgi:hypothetical protein